MLDLLHGIVNNTDWFHFDWVKVEPVHSDSLEGPRMVRLLQATIIVIIIMQSLVSSE